MSVTPKYHGKILTGLRVHGGTGLILVQRTTDKLLKLIANRLPSNLAPFIKHVKSSPSQGHVNVKEQCRMRFFVLRPAESDRHPRGQIKPEAHVILEARSLAPHLKFCEFRLPLTRCHIIPLVPSSPQPAPHG